MKRIFIVAVAILALTSCDKIDVETIKRIVIRGNASYEAAVKAAGGFSRVQRVEYFSHDVCGCGYFGIRVIGEPLKEGESSK